MDYYSIVKLVHVAAAIVWLGGGFVLLLLSVMAERSREETMMLVNLGNVSRTGNTVFMPAALVTLASGLVMAWFWMGFSQAWIVIGLAGAAFTFTMGVAVMKPTSDRLVATIVDGRLSPASAPLVRRLLALARFDYVVMLVIVIAMVMKPMWSDYVTIGIMLAILLAGAALFLAPVRRLEPASA